MYFRPSHLIRRLFPNLNWSLPSRSLAPGCAGVIYLTFDDGPTPEITPWVLDVLDSYGAKATFFCLGKNADLYPEIFTQILERGHAVGNHSYSHLKGWGMPTGRYVEDVDLAAGLIHSNLFRPPYGRITPSQVRRISEHYKIIMWDVLSRDYSQMVSPGACLKNVTKHLHDGAVIVFHDSRKAFRNLEYTLPRLLEQLQRQGYACRSIEL